ncbi:MAG: hypothetical protein IJO80_00400 [Firmicutes bacterium]|nr:hypothetical protein [Bacillota bacterium]
MDDTALLRRRLSELAERAYNSGIFTYSGFLSLAEQDVLQQCRRQLPPCGISLFGGADGCERLMLRCGSEELCGYDEPYPIACLEVVLPPKSDIRLGHRDYLGALLALGLEREQLGDIIVLERGAVLFCREAMADFICRELTSVGRANVSCRLCATPPPEAVRQTERIRVNVSQARLDAVIAHLYHLSRGDAAELLAARKVFVDGLQVEDGARRLKEGELVSLRGLGRFIYRGEVGESRKGRLLVEVEKYV